MTEDQDTKIARAAEYTMGLMDPKDTRAFEDDMVQDPDLRAIYADWAEGLVALDDDGEAPAAAVKARLDRRLFLDTAPHKKPWWLQWAIPVALALVAGFNVYSYVSGPFYDFQAEGAATDLAFDVRIDVDSRTVLASFLDQTPPDGRDFEFWIIPDGQAPISLGVLNSRETKVLPGTYDLASAVIAVTVEQKGGSPTGGPTTQPIAVVPFTAL